jgi:tetratricopeptide (TPR) repeat protein
VWSVADGGGGEEPRETRVFISYAHESEAHAESVRDLWIFLRANGVDARLDRPAAEQRQDWPLWMGDQVREADHILVIASAAYRERAEGRSGPEVGWGVQWEARLIRDAFYHDQSNLDRFLPVVLPGQSVEGVPDFLAPATSTVYEVSDFTVSGAEKLLRLLLRVPGEVEPPLGPPPALSGPRPHTLSTTPEPAPSPPERTALRHDVVVHIGLADGGGVQARTELAGTVLGEQVASLPAALARCWSELASPTGGERLSTLGKSLWHALFDDATGRRLTALIDTRSPSDAVNLNVVLADELDWLPVELLQLPDGRLVATERGVWVTRRLAGVERPATPALPGPLKILAAVAAPDETKTDSAPLDVEAEMQALLAAVTDLDLAGDALGGLDVPAEAPSAQVRILEVASLSEIRAALAGDQFHVLHLSAHGSPAGVELTDEDGNPDPVSTDQLVNALRAGAKPLPLVVLSSCSGAADAADGTDGLAASLIRRGADRVLAMHASVTDRFATALAHTLYRTLAHNPDATVAQALATARATVTEDFLATARRSEQAPSPRPEWAVPTLLAAGDDPPLRDPAAAPAPLRRHTEAPRPRGGVRELPLGELIGRRAELRIASAVLRGNDRDRDIVGEWAGLALTGIGGIGKTALAGRILARAREQGWLIAEHVGVWSPPTLFTAVADAVAAAHPQFTEALNDPTRDEATKVALVARLLAGARLVVLFDDFEQNLTPDTRAFADPGFAELFHGFVAAARTGRILVTCRYPVPDTAATLLRLELAALSPTELGRLFLRLPTLRGLPVENRRLVVRTIGGHPRLIEFLDALLRTNRGARFQHVSAKLHQLAVDEGIDLRPGRGLAEGVRDTVRLGSRDILLDALLADLTPDQRELLLQACISRIGMSVDDLAHTRHGSDATPDQVREVRGDAERLADLTLLSPAGGSGELAVHPWVADALATLHNPEQLVQRHARAAQMQLQRLRLGRGGFDDIVELVRHLAGSDQYDDAVEVALQGCDVVGGEVAVAALLAETVPLIPTTHPEYLFLADRECQALLTTGLTSATADRYRRMLTVAEQRATAEPGNATHQRALSLSHSRLGDLAVAVGDSTNAAWHYQAARAIRERLATTDPSNADYQRDLGISHERLGDLAVAVGDSTTATQHHQAARAIRERLATTDPSNADYQRDLGISHDRLGDLAAAAGDTTTATHHYQAALTITERLATTDPGNAEYQRDLSVSHNRLGDLAAAAGDTTTATQHNQAQLDIAKQLATTDPSNAEYQRDLSVSHNRLGDLAAAAGDTTTATQHYQAALTIRERLATTDPGNAEYQRDLSVSHNNLGDLAQAVGDTTTAAQHYQAQLDIAERLTTTDPNNAYYQRDLGISHDRLGDLAAAAGDTTTATHHYKAALTIAERLATIDPNNAQGQRDLSISHNKLGDLAITAGDTTAATHHYQAALTIRERLATIDPNNAQGQRDLSISHNKLGDLAITAGDTTTATQHHQAALTITQRLAANDPGNAEYQRDLAISRRKLAELETD